MYTSKEKVNKQFTTKRRNRTGADKQIHKWIGKILKYSIRVFLVLCIPLGVQEFLCLFGCHDLKGSNIYQELTKMILSVDGRINHINQSFQPNVPLKMWLSYSLWSSHKNKVMSHIVLRGAVKARVCPEQLQKKKSLHIRSVLEASTETRWLHTGDKQASGKNTLNICRKVVLVLASYIIIRSCKHNILSQPRVLYSIPQIAPDTMLLADVSKVHC